MELTVNASTRQAANTRHARNSALALSAMLVLAACDVPPVVAEFNGDSVTIQGADIAYIPVFAERYLAEAQRVCSRGGKNAEFASSRSISSYFYNHLYLCL
jgi:hypothetical protein